MYETVTYTDADKAVRVLGVSSWYDSIMEGADSLAATLKVYLKPSD
jgi:hypothetical protein